MGHPLRMYEPGVVYEITARTIREQHMLVPCEHSRALIPGVIGRAQENYPLVRLHHFVYMSNHVHMLLSADDGESVAPFVGFVNSHVARVIGNLRGSPGSMWGRRMRAIPVLDEGAMIGRMKYLLAHGCKEGLVATPAEWPGASAVPGLLGDMRLRGIWERRDRGSRRGGHVIAIPTEIMLRPIPCWAHLDEDEVRRRHVELVAQVERETAVLNASLGRTPIGRAAVMAQDPESRPRSPARSPAPRCHAISREARAVFLASYDWFCDAFRRAAAALRGRGVAAEFPVGSFPAPARYVSWHGVSGRLTAGRWGPAAIA